MKYLGECIFCGAAAFWNDEEQQVVFRRPAHDCLCMLETEAFWSDEEEGGELNENNTTLPQLRVSWFQDR